MPLDPDELAKLRAIAERQNAWADANGVAFMVVDRRGRRRVVHTGTLATMVGRRRCPRCGEEFWFDALTRRRAKYCSPPCRQAAYRERHPRPERLKPMAELAAKCQQCGRPIPEQLRRGRDTGRPALWCSPACRQKAHRARKREVWPNPAGAA